jgi:rhamnulokinase
MAGPYLAFDLGATSCRAVLGRETDGPDGLAFDEISRRENGPVARGPGLFWDIEGIWDWVLSVLADLSGRGIRPVSIGVDGWSVDHGLLDEDGQLIEPPRSYRDARTRGMAARVGERIPLKDLFRRNGLMAEDITTLCQLVAARRDAPETLRRARRLLFMPDLLRFRLCGAPATDLTLATTSQLFDIRSGSWDLELLSLFDLPAGILPPVVRESSVLSVLSGRLQEETGLGPAAVVTGASHDTAAAFSTVARREGTAILSCGTWSILGIPMDRPVFSDAIDPLRYGYEGNTDGSVRLVANIPGMWILERCRAAWRGAGIPCDYESLLRGARASRESGAVDPYDPGLAAPPNMAEAVCARLGLPGWSAPGAAPDAARAILRGLARAVAADLEVLARIAERPVERLVVISGGSRNELLNEMIAEAAGVVVERGWAEATVVGNVLNQRKALSRAGKG